MKNILSFFGYISKEDMIDLLEVRSKQLARFCKSHPGYDKLAQSTIKGIKQDVIQYSPKKLKNLKL